MLAASTSSALANNLDVAEQIQSKTNAASAQSQQRIDVSAEKALSLKAEIEQLEDEVTNLQLYRQHLTALVASQNQELMSLGAQIKEVQSTRQGVVPLMYQMIAGLKQIVASDVPLKREQRQQRVARLESMMARADVSEAEKYRRILEAYQIELDYGTKLGIYQGSIELNGESREAEIVYLGRISLIARSLDGQQFWSWDRASSKWQAVSGSLSSELNQAFSLAAKKSTPSLLTLPASLMVTEAKQ